MYNVMCCRLYVVRSSKYNVLQLRNDVKVYYYEVLLKGLPNCYLSLWSLKQYILHNALLIDFTLSVFSSVSRANINTMYKSQPSLVWCPGQNKSIAPLPFLLHFNIKNMLTVLIP
jgi:hypothetical protein